ARALKSAPFQAGYLLGSHPRPYPTHYRPAFAFSWLLYPLGVDLSLRSGRSAPTWCVGADAPWGLPSSAAARYVEGREPTCATAGEHYPSGLLGLSRKPWPALVLIGLCLAARRRQASHLHPLNQ